MNDNITVYRFKNAPNQLRRLSNNGGDEDWIAVVPKNFYEKYSPIDWLEESCHFGISHVDKYKLDNGDIVFIGCHS